MSGRCNFTVDRGMKWAPQVSDWLDEDGAVVAPSSYAGAEFTVDDRDTGATLVTLAAGSGVTLGATAIDLLLTPTQTAALPLGSHPYVMTLTGGDGYPFAFLEGVVTVRDLP